ncbi:arsenate reductase family protein [Helicobacter sp.]|uniref:arsenate reductase family protein n=1 Tax=Helicobacter sp. TaxID=218 RepID=UPI00199AD08F|nr:arsenate reductase family protein [Helicobacter sp.]MBD5164249.1 Spx/MgsR family RNA polymerase-binding regulatory protein [Helicobacter sp.]
MIRVYGIKNCGSVKKALNFLESKAIPYQFVDFKAISPTHKDLEHWLEFVSLEALFNKKGTTYRNLGLKNLELTSAEIEEWLIKQPMLIKRPVIEYPNGVIVGFDEEFYKNVQWLR